MSETDWAMRVQSIRLPREVIEELDSAAAFEVAMGWERPSFTRSSLIRRELAGYLQRHRKLLEAQKRTREDLASHQNPSSTS